jgi:hypothetical protein
VTAKTFTHSLKALAALALAAGARVPARDAIPASGSTTRMLVALITAILGLAAWAPQGLAGGRETCPVRCITSGAVYPLYDFALFSVQTVADTKLSIVVATDPGFKNVVSFGGDLTYASSHTAGVLKTLSGNTTYHFELVVTDTVGHSEAVTGTFKTMRKKVTVEVTKITVLDDTDDLSAGDLYFSPGMNGAFQSALGRFVTLDTGDGFDPNWTLTELDPPDELRLWFHGNEDDCFGSCMLGMGDVWDEQVWAWYAPGEVGFADLCGTGQECAGVMASWILPDDGEKTTEQFTLVTDEKSLKFKVKGSWTVEYVGFSPILL